ncbi:MAG: helix-turn-helix domain-containing protein [Anaerovoracaceae bacterium]
MLASSRDGKVTAAALPDPQFARGGGDAICGVSGEESSTLRDARSRFEADYIESILKKNGYNVEQCASELGITARQLWNKISRYNIQRHKKQ